MFPPVADRIAQTVVKQVLEPIVEPLFHEDSMATDQGNRPSRHWRKRCWKYAWVVEIDIKGFFDNIDHDLLLRAVQHHTGEHWVVMYIERWLKSPVQMPDGMVQQRTRGTPQGGVISPLLANLFLHYAFDLWMQRQHGDVPFERYADDAVCHCVAAMLSPSRLLTNCDSAHRYFNMARKASKTGIEADNFITRVSHTSI